MLSLFTMDSKKLGNVGEEIATTYLRERGYQVIERNFYIRGGEIDLIMLDEKTLVFVEVKTRTQTDFGSGIEAITRNKKRILRRTMQTYIEKITAPSNKENQNADKNPIIKFTTIRFDVISLELDLQNSRVKKLTHIKNIDMS